MPGPTCVPVLGEVPETRLPAKESDGAVRLHCTLSDTQPRNKFRNFFHSQPLVRLIPIASYPRLHQ